MTTRIVRSKLRIDLLCQALIELLEAYPELSTNALATAVEWTQSSFQRSLESRGLEAATQDRTGRKSVSELVGEFGMARNFEAITQLLDAIETAAHLQYTPETELPGYEPPAEKPAKVKRAKKAEAAEGDLEDDLEAGLEDVLEDDADADSDFTGEDDFNADEVF
jgi:hypothetical protein